MPPAPAAKNLAAISTILNPSVSGQILSWHNNDQANLVVEQLTAGILSAASAPTFKQTSATPTGNILNPSSIVSLWYNGMINVYGWTGNKELTRLSPVTAPINGDDPAIITTSTINAIAGTNNPAGDLAYLYYVQTVDDGMPTSIAEWQLGVGDAGDFDSQIVNAGTYLAAGGYYDSDGTTFRRFVVYQTMGGNKTYLFVYIPGVGASQIPHTESAMKQTPLAACWVPGPTEGHLGYICVYFVDGQNNACRVVRAVASSTWSDVTTFDKLDDVEPYSQLAVVPVKENQETIMTWVVKSKTGKAPGFAQQVDKWSSFIKK
ncbi:hypothetical protein ABW19_dt0201157 [Dactylella cylindrospora]|nr:hypothetical protein ABW19_dt0201157 [Dactylella cylindrospora]